MLVPTDNKKRLVRIELSKLECPVFARLDQNCYVPQLMEDLT